MLAAWDTVRAGLLVEADLLRENAGCLPDVLPAAVREFRGIPVLRRLRLIRTWLELTSPATDRAVIPVCRATVLHFVTIRDSELEQLNVRREFLEESRDLWLAIQTKSFEQIENADAVSANLELELLSWAEQFENRILFEETLAAGPPLPSARIRNADVETDRWAFKDLWTESAIAETKAWLDELNPGRSHCLRYSESADLSLENSIDGRTTPNSMATPVPETQLRDKNEWTQSAFAHQYANDIFFGLRKRVPDGAVWIRTLFDTDGVLRWSAWHSKDSELVMLAQGRSRPQSYSRLVEANLEFDLTVERVWDAFAERDISTMHGPARLAFARILTEDALRKEALRSRSDRFQSRSMIRRFLSEVRVTNPALASVGDRLAEMLQMGISAQEIATSSRFRQWTMGWSAQEEWQNADLDESWRRAVLDQATQQQLSVLRQELNLQSLSESTAICWDETDLIFQVQGPLLAIPLALLDFGRDSLIRRVASISNAVSLTLQYAGNTSSEHKASANILSALWLDPQERNKAFGLPLLHYGLKRIAGESNFWPLGDTPQANIENVNQALAHREYLMAFIGGHGSALHAGIKLADANTLWQGDDTSLKNVDTLVINACAVGRLDQEFNRDVKGLVARLFANGARNIVAAKWPISDYESSILLTEFCQEYMNSVQAGHARFACARALTRARRTVLDNQEISMHLAVAFEMFGSH